MTLDGQKFQPTPSVARQELSSVMKKTADDIMARPNARLSNGWWNPNVVSKEDVSLVAQMYPRPTEPERGLKGDKVKSGFGLLGKTLMRPLVTPEMVGKLPDWAQPIGSAARELTSPTMLALTALTAGAGPAVAAGIKGVPLVAGVKVGTATRAAATARAAASAPLQPMVKGGIKARFGSELAVGTTAELGAHEVAKRVPEDAPLGIKIGAALAGGLVGGGLGIGGVAAATRAFPGSIKGVTRAGVTPPSATPVVNNRPVGEDLFKTVLDEQRYKKNKFTDKSERDAALSMLDEDQFTYKSPYHLKAAQDAIDDGWIVGDTSKSNFDIAKKHANMADDLAAQGTAARASTNEAVVVAVKWRTAKTKNELKAQNDLDTLQSKGYETTDADDLLDEYVSIDKSDFETVQEYSEARTNAWDDFVDGLDEIEPLEEVIEAGTSIDPILSATRANATTQPVGGSTGTPINGDTIGSGAGAGTPQPRTSRIPNANDFGENVKTAQREDVWRRIANLPGIRSIIGVVNPSAIANDPTAQSVVGRASLHSRVVTQAQTALSRLNSLGRQEDVFGVLDTEGRIVGGRLNNLLVNDLQSNVQKYRKLLTKEQIEWLEEANILEADILKWAQDNNIDINVLEFAPGSGESYASRIMYGKVNPITNNVDVLRPIGKSGGKIGSPIGAEKHRVFGSINEAIDAGYRYLPQDEVLFLKVQSLLKRQIDNQMADWLLLRVKWRGIAVPEAVKVASYQANRKVLLSRQLLASLNRAVRGERVPPSTLASIASAYPEAAERLKYIIDNNPSKGAKTKQVPTGPEVQSLDADSKLLIAEAKDEAFKAKANLAKAKEESSKAKIGEYKVNSPAFTGKIFTGPDAEQTAKTLTDSMDSTFSNWKSSVNKVNSVSRYFALGHDISQPMIQLLYLAGYKPRVYGSSLKAAFESMRSDRWLFQYRSKPENIAIVNKYNGIVLTQGGQTEATEALAKGGLLEVLLPKRLQKVLSPFQRGWEGGVDVAGIELLKALDHLGTSPARIADITSFVNNFRGLGSSANLGVSKQMQQWEQAALLAPRYNRANIALLFDLMNGGLKGDLARDALGRGVTAVVLMGAALSFAMGETTEEVMEHMMPHNPNFMTWKVGGQNVGPGTKIRSILRLLALSAKDPEKLLDTSVGWGELEYMRNPVIKFGRGLSSPVVSTSWDLLTGKDFIGDPTRDGMLSFTKTVAEDYLPIWAQGAILDGGTVTDRAIRGGAEFGGLRAYPRNFVWELSSKWEDDMSAYNEIPPSSQLARGEISRVKYRERNPEIDAKLFITGQVTSLNTFKAVDLVLKMMKDNNLSSEDIKGITARQKVQADAGRRLEINKVDVLLRRLKQNLELSPVESTPPTTNNGSINWSDYLRNTGTTGRG